MIVPVRVQLLTIYPASWLTSVLGQRAWSIFCRCHVIRSCREKKAFHCHAWIGWCYWKHLTGQIEHVIKWNCSHQEYGLTTISVKWNASKKAFVLFIWITQPWDSLYKMMKYYKETAWENSPLKSTWYHIGDNERTSNNVMKKLHHKLFAAPQ